MKNAILSVVSFRLLRRLVIVSNIHRYSYNAIQDDVNVILVDWSQGNGFPYEKATANTQIVGAEIGLLVNYMIKEHGSKATDFHLVGHSLGSHISGYAGSRIPGLGRITGNYLLK